jgi:hypothetical protein
MGKARRGTNLVLGPVRNVDVTAFIKIIIAYQVHGELLMNFWAGL